MAVMLVKPATPVSVMAASVLPAMTAVQRPEAMSRAALATECVPAAQAVTTFSHGPWKPYFIETAAAGALPITIGMRNGETRRGPFSYRTMVWSSIVCRPPMPVPTMTPRRTGSPVGRPDCAIASAAAAVENCSKRSARRTSFGLA